MIKKMIAKVKGYLDDPNLDVKYKSFILLSLIALIGIFLACVSGLLLGQSIFAFLSNFTEFILFSCIVAYAIYFNKLDLAMYIISSFLVFVFLPLAFFTSGGAAGGTPVWFMFATLYILLVLRGKTEVFFLSAQCVVTAVCWWLGYMHPEWIVEFSREDAYVDSIFTLLIVGVIMAILLGFQTALFRRENGRVRAQNKQIESLNRSQNLFFSMMSHEIRTPINSIIGLNEVILRSDDASDEIIRDATNIQGAGRMLLTLINDILDFSKIEAGRMDIVPVEYRVSDMVCEIVNMIWLRAKEKGLSFEADAAPDMPAALYGDEVRIKQIMINLLGNAVKYTASGTVRLRVRAEKTDDVNKVTLVISVSDTGMGIKEDALPELFDAFKRIDQQKNRKIEGTGLGLAIVKQLVDLMGGEIRVDSTYGKGTIFTVCLPQKVTDPVPLGEIDLREQAVSAQKYERLFTAPDASILIVDDNDMNLKVEQKLLADTLVTVDTVMSGAEALKKTTQVHYDLILMDHFMPGMDGIECLKAIRGQIDGLCSGTPVVILTANAGAENRALYDASGFAGYLTKPVSGRQLEEVLLKHIPAGKIKSGEDRRSFGRRGKEAASGKNAGANDRDFVTINPGGRMAGGIPVPPGIDMAEALKYNGSEEVFAELWEIFKNSAPEKGAEIENLCKVRDWSNYTIKVHALKSSARLVGATALADLAQKLENAGDAGDEAYITEHHDEMMKAYRALTGTAEKKRLIIIDDDDVYGRIITSWLRDRYQTETFTNGEEGVVWLSSNGADLVLLDYRMPGMNGRQVLELIRSDPRTASVPVVFLTGEDNAQDMDELKALDAQGFVLKTDVSKNELTETVEKILGRR